MPRNIIVELLYLWNVIGLPLVGTLVPIFFLVRRLRGSDYYVPLSLKKKLIGRFFLIFVVIFLTLIFLTGGIAEFFYLETGFFINSYEFKWNITRHWAIIFLWYPGTTFLALSILLAATYAVHFTLPPVCARVEPEVMKQEGRVSTTASSSIGAMFSASASLVSCCSPSLVALISPIFSSAIGSFIPQLLVFSMVMVNYSFFKIVLPRFPEKLEGFK